MNKQTVAIIVEEGSKIISQFVQHFMSSTQVSSVPGPSEAASVTVTKPTQIIPNPILALSEIATKD